MLLTRIKRALLKELKRYSPRHQWHNEDSPIPIAKAFKEKLFRAGFKPTASLVYDFKKFGAEAFVNDRDYRVLHPINRGASQLIDNKAFLPLLFQSSPELLPDFFAHLGQGKLKFQRGSTSESRDPAVFLKEALARFGKLIIKPTSEGGGSNILFLDEGNFEKGIQKIQKGEFVINEFLENVEFIAKIYPDSLNTFRVVFFKNQNGVNQILMMAHRFGNLMSKGVDNVSSGGLACSIDLETGTFSKAYSYVSNEYKGWFASHMETNEPIEGVSIPNWNETFEKIKNLVRRLDWLDYAGLDLAFTTKGLKLIEINSLPHPRLMQVGGPALQNPEFKEFLISKGYNPKIPKSIANELADF